MWKKTRENRDVDKLLKIGHQSIFFIVVFVSITGLLLDLIFVKLNRDSFFYIDFLTILIYVITLIFLITKKIKLPLSFGIIVYAMFFNIFLTLFLKSYKNDSIPNFFRDTVFIVFFITLASYIISKYQAFILTTIYIILLTIFLWINPGNELQDGIFTLFIGVTGYAIILFYFVGIQEKTLTELHHTSINFKKQNEELLQHQEEVVTQRDAMEKQKAMIESRNKEIISGIRFAKSIQESVLQPESILKHLFKQYFFYSKPKSVISGDFFWVKEWHNKLFVAMVDCTGHGVPGALVSMLANMFLGRSFIELEDPDPAKILNYINKAISTELNIIESFHSRVGMDIALISIERGKNNLEFAGAFSPLYIIRRDRLIQLDSSKIMMGFYSMDFPDEYVNQSYHLHKGDRIYLFSDGMADQFGGPHQKKFGYKRFRNALVDTNHNDMATQKELLLKKWYAWKQDNQQVDDVLIIGLEV